MGFWEFVVIAVVGLVVLGPDKLPSALRSLIKTKRQVSQMAQGLSAEVSEQLRVHELHENLKKAEQQGFKNIAPELQQSVDELKQAAESVNQPIPELQSELKQEKTGTLENNDKASQRDVNNDQ